MLTSALGQAGQVNKTDIKQILQMQSKIPDMFAIYVYRNHTELTNLSVLMTLFF